MGRGCWILAACVWAVAARGAGEHDPYAGVRANDPIALARLAEDLGDAALSAQLKLGLPRRRTLVAVGAAPFAHEAERLVPGLAGLAAGRDPQLAPAAAAALWDLCERLDPAELAAREVDPSLLTEAQRALQAVRAEPLPREDILFAVDQAAGILLSVRQQLGLTAQ